MADLSDIQSALPVKVAGANPVTGIEDNFMEVNSDGTTNARIHDNAGNGITSTSIVGKQRLDVNAVYGDSPNNDAFGRLRVSEPVSLFESTFQYDAQPLQWSSQVAGGGAATHNANTASVDFTVGTASGDSVIFQTRQYFKYHPGKSQFVVFTGKIAAPQVNLRQRAGQFDANNGIFFETDGTTLYVAVRSKVSGSVVDTKVAQASWNLDRLDGTGSSGVTLDVTKQQILFFDYQWLGSGRIRIGTIIAGKIIYAHEFLFANSLATPYSQTGTLPFRLELVNTGVTGGASSSRLTCAAIYSEGGFTPEGFARTVNNGVTYKAIAASGKIPVLSLRKTAAGIAVPIKILGASLFCGTVDDLLVTFTINPTLTGATFAITSGFGQADTAATAMTGGTEVHSFYIRGAAGATSERLEEQFFNLANVVLGSTIAGVSDIFTISATSITGVASAAATINFKELS